MKRNPSEQAREGGQRWQHCLACGSQVGAERGEFGGPYCPECADAEAGQP